MENVKLYTLLFAFIVGGFWLFRDARCKFDDAGYYSRNKSSKEVKNKLDFLVLISILIRFPIVIISLPLFAIFHIIKSVFETIIMFIVVPIMIIFFNKNKIRSFGFYQSYLQDLVSFCSIYFFRVIYWIFSGPDASLIHVHETPAPVYHFILNIFSWGITIYVLSEFITFLLSLPLPL